MARKKGRIEAAVERELALLKQQERRLARRAGASVQPRWKRELRQKLPEQVRRSLEGAFSKACSVVFTRGVSVIGRTCQRERMEQSHQIQHHAVLLGGGRRELRRLRWSAERAARNSTALTAVEGVGLGVLGMGLPDLVLFLGMLLKGIYEMALGYGIACDTPGEQLLILRMLEAALTRGEDFGVRDAAVEQILLAPPPASERDLWEQSGAVGRVFAEEMLLLKVVQGIPVMGILGGAANPLYCGRIMEYVGLKYRKRYLLSLVRQSAPTAGDGL